MKLTIGKKPISLVAIDIGSAITKIAEVEYIAEEPKLKSVAIFDTPPNAVAGSGITNPDALGQIIRKHLDNNSISAEGGVFSIPGSSVFIKRISIPTKDLAEFQSNFQLEAGTHIPQDISTLDIDYQILKSKPNGNSEILLVAARREIVESYRKTIESAGLIPLVADIDYFALENMFELDYASDTPRMIALVDIGAKFSSFDIIYNNISIYNGDLPVGTASLVDSIARALDADNELAQKILTEKEVPATADKSKIDEVKKQAVEELADAVQRQIVNLWSASGSERTIDEIYLTGGASQIDGLIGLLSEKTDTNVKVIEPFKFFEGSTEIDPGYLKDISPVFGVVIGLALRRLGDKKRYSPYHKKS